ncbi:type II toxin-antitoxin system HipA family toxin [Parafrigoribacterium humi]|uniref:type II toxin-antitoxin system HipA family toxin n=1 Tax=Parafrigoribacterium humi TaxID=3144664 RepID=UPI0032EF0F17
MTTERADVFKAGRHAATLARTTGGVEFSYLPDYLGSAVATAIASTLPLTDQPRVTAAGAVPPYFAGLLPEGRRLTNLRQTIKTSADDELSLLVAVGADPIGDVQVVAAGDQPGDVEAIATVEKNFSDIRFSDLLRDAGIIDPIGIAGVQDKVSARVLSLPVRRAHERFILKLDPPGYPHVVENEAFFIALSARAGIPTVDAAVVRDVEGRPGLLVTRFDRVVHNGAPTRLAVEDACQAQDLWPADKYNTTAERTAQALIRLCAAETIAARDVFRQLVFAWLTGNGDVHAKNLSALTHPDGETRIAPGYDLPSTVLYGDKTLALSIEGKRSGLSRRLFLQFAAKLGMREKAAGDILDRLLDSTSNLDDALSDAAIPFDNAILQRARRELTLRRKQLL